MERVLIVNADDFGLSKGQNYGIIEACRNGVVTSTTALVNGAAIDHAAQLSRSTPELAVGMHFVLTLGEPLSAMPGLTRDGRLGKWIWQQAEEDSRNLGSADIRIRSDCSILIANDICKVIITIQGFGNIRCLPARINGFITRHFNFCDFIR